MEGAGPRELGFYQADLGAVEVEFESTRSPGQHGHMPPAPRTSLQWVLTQGKGSLGDTETVRWIYFEAIIAAQLVEDPSKTSLAHPKSSNQIQRETYTKVRGECQGLVQTQEEVHSEVPVVPKYTHSLPVPSLACHLVTVTSLSAVALKGLPFLKQLVPMRKAGKETKMRHRN